MGTGTRNPSTANSTMTACGDRDKKPLDCKLDNDSDTDNDKASRSLLRVVAERHDGGHTPLLRHDKSVLRLRCHWYSRCASIAATAAAAQ